MEVFAHRGASGICPENTMAAFRKAIEEGAKLIELDVQLTKDGKVVVIHDYTLERTTNGKGLVMDINYERLKTLDAGSWFHSDYQKEYVPKLRELVEILPRDIIVNIEIKSYYKETRDLARSVLEIVEGIEDQVIISSFDHRILMEVRAYSKNIKIGMLYYGNIYNIEKNIESTNIEPYSIHLSAEYLDSKQILDLKNLGYKVYSYTVNNKDLLRSYPMLDGYFTDYPRNYNII